jgi:MFS family permease
MKAGRGAMVVSMFLGSFAWGFSFISLPFYVQAISTTDPATTLRWTGWIVGISSLVTVVTGPVWARLASAGDPRRYYVLIQLGQGLGFLIMSLTRTPLQLFATRFLVGFTGAASTLAFLIVGRDAGGPEVRRQIAAIQTAMTIGQVTGPLGGALVAARIGIPLSFIVGGLILLGSAAFVQWGVSLPARVRTATAAPRPLRPRQLVADVVVVLTISTQLFFLTSVLPEILSRLGIAPEDLIEFGGILVFVSAVAAGLGAMAAPRLASLGPERYLTAGMLVASAACVASLALPRGVTSYTVIRFLQVLCAAPIFPFIVGRVAQQGSGTAVGIINSARIGASFTGPIVATTLLAMAPPAALYGVLALAALACIPLVLFRGSEREAGVRP